MSTGNPGDRARSGRIRMVELALPFRCTETAASAVPTTRGGEGERCGPGAPAISGSPRDVSRGDGGGRCGVGDPLCTSGLPGTVSKFVALLVAPGAVTCMVSL
mmetsp:Transcript_84892/g.147242  ORF Transcript_84892/g.147242 Transcript_84892/m.147242 type:complete len:103 (+) Transcript_84892:301-609(+)